MDMINQYFHELFFQFKNGYETLYGHLSTVDPNKPIESSAFQFKSHRLYTLNEHATTMENLGLDVAWNLYRLRHPLRMRRYLTNIWSE